MNLRYHCLQNWCGMAVEEACSLNQFNLTSMTQRKTNLKSCQNNGALSIYHLLLTRDTSISHIETWSLRQHTSCPCLQSRLRPFLRIILFSCTSSRKQGRLLTCHGHIARVRKLTNHDNLKVQGDSACSNLKFTSIYQLLQTNVQNSTRCIIEGHESGWEA